jgi:hypothetical protein
VPISPTHEAVSGVSPPAQNRGMDHGDGVTAVQPLVRDRPDSDDAVQPSAVGGDPRDDPQFGLPLEEDVTSGHRAGHRTKG